MNFVHLKKFILNNISYSCTHNYLLWGRSNFYFPNWHALTYSTLEVSLIRGYDQSPNCYFSHESDFSSESVSGGTARGEGRGWHHKAITSCVFPINQCLPHNLLPVNWDWPVSRVTCQFSAAVSPHCAELCAYGRGSFWLIPSLRSRLPHSSLCEADITLAEDSATEGGRGFKEVIYVC